MSMGDQVVITGGAYEGRIGFLLAIEHPWARVRLSGGLLLLSSSLIEGI
jgi:hypothetical protein